MFKTIHNSKIFPIDLLDKSFDLTCNAISYIKDKLDSMNIEVYDILFITQCQTTCSSGIARTTSSDASLSIVEENGRKIAILSLTSAISIVER
jgi:hypothetical protein